MESQSMENDKRIFRRELALLKEKDYISEENYETTLKAHHKYYSELEMEKQEKSSVPAVKKTVKPAIPQQVKVEKRRLTPEELRERNISWLLNIGVIFLLIGGLFVATSNWDTMSSWMKSGSIAFVSLVFYAIAYISKKILKIERTSFAFIVLGSLFLPIFILSIGWFKLLGPYLSFYGEGRHILGAAGSFLLFPVYGLFAKNLKSRLFVWFSYIVLTIGVGYTLAAFSLEEDGFYFGIMIFNALLVAGFHWLKNKESMKLFSRELVYFTQINLVLSTILMMAFFESHVFYSLNVLLTAAVYLSMVYVSGRKEYHFVFSVMVVYGIYQLIEHSILDGAGPVFYALASAAFLAVPKVLGGPYQWEKVFRLTSAVVSVCAFLYISAEGIFMRMNEPSYALLLAYMIIAAQFTYLAKVMKNSLFAYLSPIFLGSALFEIVLILDKVFHFESFIFPVFLIGFTIFLVFGYALKIPMVKIIVQSSRDVGTAIMFFSIMIGLSIFDWLLSGCMLLLFSLVLFILDRVENRSFYRDATPWAIPLAIGLAFMAFGEEMRNSLSYYLDHLGMAMNAVLATSAILLLSYYWKLKKYNIHKRNAFYLAQGFYTVGMLAAIILPINEVWMRPAVLIGGICLYIGLYTYKRFRWIPFIIAGASLVTYFSIIYSFFQLESVPLLIEWSFLPFGAFILLAAAFFQHKKDHVLANGFSWIGHIYLPMALLLTFFVYGERSFWSFIGAIAVYWISSRMTLKEWKVKIFLYSSFISLFMAVSIGMRHYFDGSHGEFAYFVLSLLLFVFWFNAKKADKERTIYFLIPWSVMGIMAFLITYPFTWLPYTAAIFYSAGLLVFLHIIKKDILAGLPLFLLFIGTLEFLFMSGMEAVNKMLVLGGFGMIAAICGKMLYQRIFIWAEKLKQVDSYVIAALLFFLSMYLFQPEPLWGKILPGTLISLLIFFQRNRVAAGYSWLPAISAGIYLLEPYYSLLRSIELPDLIIREAHVLPLVGAVIFIRFCLKEKYSKITGRLQWAVLIAASLLLIQDGLASSTVYDALILGTLALISMLAGTFLRVKSYFFVGSGVLLLNVLLQTRPYWGNLPWWAYLLIAGSILITVASYNEWHKQKTARGESTLFSVFKKNILKKMKEWE